MWDRLLSCQLPQLVKEDVELELGLQVGQTPVAEALERPVSYHGTHVLHVRHEPREVGHVVLYGGVIGEVRLSLVDLENSFDNFSFVTAILECCWTLPGVCLRPRRMNGMI